MKKFISNIFDILSQAPMFIAFVAVAIGVLLADHFTPPLWSVVVGFCVCVGMAVARYNKTFYRLYIILSLLFAGGISILLSRADLNLDQENELIQLTIKNIKTDEKGAIRADAQVEQVGDVRCDFMVRVTSQKEVNLRVGEELLIKSHIRDFTKHKETKKREQEEKSISSVRYQEYMLRQGFRGEIYLRPEMIIDRKMIAPTLAQMMQEVANERISQLRLNSDVEAIVRAVAVGDQGLISQQLRKDYVQSGAAHLLAVSGLHIGYIFLLMNIFLLPLALLRRGWIIRVFLAIIIIWIYALMTGMQPSVMRAAIMFTILQISIAVASRYNPLNTLAFTGLLMLLWRAENIYDAGFQLSMLAVFAIIEWVIPLVGRSNLEGRIRGLFRRGSSSEKRWLRVMSMGFIKGLKWLIISVMISFAASIITLPLSSYLFGQISLWSVVVGPLMVLLGGVTVMISILWIILPIGAIDGEIGWMLELTVGYLNSIAEWCGKVGVLAHEVRIDFGICITIYMCYLLLTIIGWGVRKLS